MKCVWTLGFALVLWGAGKTPNPKPKAPNPKPKEPLAVVLSVSGNVRIVRAGGKKTERAQAGAPLNKGDTVRAWRKSKATLVLSDGKVVEVAASKRFTLAPSRPSDGGGGKVAFDALIAKLRSVSNREGAMLPPVVRGKGKRDTLTLVHPREFENPEGKRVPSFVRADAPTFVWTPGLEAQASHFAVLEEGRPLFEKTLEPAAIKSLTVGGMIIYRPTELNLTPGRAYSWRVEVRFAQGARSETRAFAVLADEQAAKVKEALTGLNPPEGGTTRGAARSVVCGAFLESDHLFADATAEYLHAIAADPKQPVYRQLLADLLGRSELYDLADGYRAGRNAGK